MISIGFVTAGRGIVRRSPGRHLASMVYTKTGDGGSSQLFTGERRSKSDPVFEALGSTDELNGHLGVAREHAANDGLTALDGQLQEIMSRLFDVGAAVATPLESAKLSKMERTWFDGAERTRELEVWIDELDQTLPPLKNFVLPSGGLCAAQLHVARSVCRRAERSVHELVRVGSVEPEVGFYMNRLSDYLFMAARAAAQQNGHPEILWKKVQSTRPPATEEA